jgi:two-component system nitrate/nitrite response regulator NarL
MRIVVCDDDMLLLAALSRALELKGFMVEATVSTSRDAVAAVKRFHPDVLLIDLGLPDGNGLGAAREVMRDHPGTKVVILTASDDPSAVLEADRLSLAGYVSKDMRLDSVVEALRRAASGTGKVDKALLRRFADASPKESEASVLDKLTAQERVVLGCLGDGLSTSEIVTRLGIGHTTVRSHIQAILDKLGVHSRIQAVAVLRDGSNSRAVGQ